MPHTPRLLAEAIREKLSSPSDWQQNSTGTLRVERAWLPVFQLADTTETVVTVLAADDSAETISRAMHREETIEIDFSVQRLLTADPQSEEGKLQIDEVCDFAQECLQTAYTVIGERNVRRYMPMRYERLILDSALNEWNQVCVLFSITYKSVG